MANPVFWRKNNAFTLIEVIAALAVVAIAMVALIRLHLISINMTDSADVSTQATLLAQEKMTAALSDALSDRPTVSQSGAIQQNNRQFNWQSQITDLHLPQLDGSDLTGLRRLRMDISWKQGRHDKHVTLTTYVAKQN